MEYFGESAIPRARSAAARALALLALAATLAAFCAGCSRAPFPPDETIGRTSGGEFFDQSLLVAEDGYGERMKSEVVPFLESAMREGTLETERGSRIHWETLAAGESKAVIVMFEGFCEFTRKFDEVAYYFLKSGYSVCRFDHRGLGLSSRDVDDPSLVHIKSFDIYVDDAAEVVEKIARPMAGGGPLFLFAHSMGGCVGALLMERRPGAFSKAVLSTPMLAVQTGVPEWMAAFLSFFKTTFGQGDRMVFSHKRFTGVFDFDPNFSYDGKNPRTQAEARAKYQFDMRAADERYQTTAATYGWTRAAIKATKEATARRNVERVQIPVLMFKAQNDSRVRPEGEDKFRRRSDVATLAYYPGVEHEIYNSKDEYLAPYYSRVLEFYAK